jgi:ADP-dependent NAD(P)H-hydrate dehydratase / NAD(P)H-hydrate epimerase
MQLLATADIMRGLDRRAIDTVGVPGLVLMENAGRAFVDELETATGPVGGRHAVIVCGKGNNGGDGFVIARHLANRGGEVTVLLLSAPGAVRGDAKTNLDALLGMSRLRSSRVRIGGWTGKVRTPLPGSPGIVVDAIFGTGFSGNIAGKEREAVAWINAAGESGAFVASVDIPSGVDASTGSVGNAAVKANLTVTMGLAKIGHYVGRGCDASGRVRVVDISIPASLFAAAPREAVYRILAEDVLHVLPSRPRNAHKYSAGKVLVVAGSRSFTGAPVMTAGAALRAGAGAVVLAAPASVQKVLARKLTEVILASLEETASGSIAMAALPQVQSRGAWADALAIGPGLSRDEETMEFVRALIRSVDKPLVIDADALFALQGQTSILKGRSSPVILTPHTGEFASLAGGDAREADALRVSAARAAARRFASVVVLKGAPTVTAVPGGTVYVNSTGNPGMATIGSGDVLTGIIAGLAAQGMKPGQSAYAGVFIHGLAGDRGASRYGERSLIATDIGDAISGAISEITLSRTAR